MIVLSPERYDFLVHSAERGHIWDAAIESYKAGGRGVAPGQVLREVANDLGTDV